MEQQTVSVRNGMFNIQMLKGGSGKPLVILHAAGGLRPGTPWIEALAQHYTVYAPWTPGWGESTGIEHLDDVRDLATFHLDLFDALGLESPAVIGHSFGGMVAAEVAAQCSPAVSRLVLVAPVGLWRDDAPVADIFTMGPRDMAQALFHDLESPAAKAMSTMPEDPEQVAAMQIERMQSLAAAGRFLWPIPDKGLKKRLHRIKAPTLILWGESDRLAPPIYAEEFRSRIPNAQVRVVKEAGHALPAEQQEQFIRAIRVFVG